MIEPPKGSRTGCAFYPVPSLKIYHYASFLVFSTAFVSKTYDRCVHWSTYDAMVYRHINVIGVKASFAYNKFSKQSFFSPQPFCCFTMVKAIVSLEHFPLASIFCSGTGYLLCTFACTSAFDALLGLILATQSLSQLHRGSLDLTSRTKTRA